MCSISDFKKGNETRKELDENPPLLTDALQKKHYQDTLPHMVVCVYFKINCHQNIKCTYIKLEY